MGTKLVSENSNEICSVQERQEPRTVGAQRWRGAEPSLGPPRSSCWKREAWASSQRVHRSKLSEVQEKEEGVSGRRLLSKAGRARSDGGEGGWRKVTDIKVLGAWSLSWPILSNGEPVKNFKGRRMGLICCMKDGLEMGKTGYRNSAGRQ